MAVEESEELFTKWLTKKLKGLDVEDDVLASYISSIVTTEDVDADKKDILLDIFEDLVQGVNNEALCDEILKEWSECRTKLLATQCIEENCMDLSERVSLIVGKSVQPVMKANDRSEEEERIREAILARCNYISDEEEDCEEEEGASSTPHIPAPQNSESVAVAEKAKRDKMKAESQEKKAQDKVNREKQKAKQDERREKERKRTQKGERRR